MYTTLPNPRWGRLIADVLWVLLGLAIFLLGAVTTYFYVITSYQPQEFHPYRSDRAQIIPGYNFQPGYPSVTLSMDEFRKKSAGQKFILSYSSGWASGISPGPNDGHWKISYVMKAADADIYYFAEEQIPNYDKFRIGSFGHSEQTRFDPGRMVFFSQTDGRATATIVWAIIFLILGALMTWGLTIEAIDNQK